jgi:hypothetical protein
MITIDNKYNHYSIIMEYRAIITRIHYNYDYVY